MPTEDEILVPETLLKKRKSQEKAREERQAEFDKKKKVSYISLEVIAFDWGTVDDRVNHTDSTRLHRSERRNGGSYSSARNLMVKYSEKPDGHVSEHA